MRNIRTNDRQQLLQKFLTRLINGLAYPAYCQDACYALIAVNDLFCDLVGKKRAEISRKNPLGDSHNIKQPKSGIVDRYIIDSGGVERLVRIKKASFVTPSGASFYIGVIRPVLDKEVKSEEPLEQIINDSTIRGIELLLPLAEFEQPSPGVETTGLDYSSYCLNHLPSLDHSALATILAGVPAGALYRDCSGDIVFTNPEFERIVKRSGSRLEDVDRCEGEHWREVLCSRFTDSLDTQYPSIANTRYLNQDGQNLEVFVSDVVVKDAQGLIQGILTLVNPDYPEDRACTKVSQAYCAHISIVEFVQNHLTTLGGSLDDIIHPEKSVAQRETLQMLLESERISTRLGKKLNQLLKQRGINYREWKVLNAIQVRHIDSPVQMADHLSLARPAVSHLLDTMENKRLIERTYNHADRRRVSLSFTAKGEKLWAFGSRQAEKLYSEIGTYSQR